MFNIAIGIVFNIKKKTYECNQVFVCQNSVKKTLKKSQKRRRSNPTSIYLNLTQLN